MIRKVVSSKPATQKNELNGRDVAAEPPAGKKTKYGHLTDRQVINKSRATGDTRKNLRVADSALWKEANDRGLLEKIYGPKKKRKKKYGHLSNRQLLKKVKATGAKIRRDLLHIDCALHCEMVRRDLLEEAFGPSKRNSK